MKLLKICTILWIGQGIAFGQLPLNSPFGHETGDSLTESFQAPVGYTTRKYDVGSFADKIQNLTLKPDCKCPKNADGALCPKLKGCAIIDWPIEDQPLRQCADTATGLRIYHLLEIGTPDEQISFQIPYENYVFKNNAYTLLNIGYKRFSLADWKAGKRILQSSYKLEKIVTREDSQSESIQGFINYMYETIGSGHLEASMEKVSLAHESRIQVGDVLIDTPDRQGGYGHVQIILNIADNDISCAKDDDCQAIRLVIGDGNMNKGLGTEMRVLEGDTPDSPWKTLQITQGKVFGQYELYRFKEPV